ncbi:MAG: cytochrome d ubiquinol oxidase subunit II, partial [bacterium]
ENIRRQPAWLIIVAVSILAVANIPRAVRRGRVFQAFVSSGAALASMVGLIALLLWPNLVTASNNPANSLTVQRAASSEHTLWVMLIIVAIGMPFVLAYTVTIYWTFRGKVEITEHGY